jgi:dienelactone hydrolase
MKTANVAFLAILFLVQPVRGQNPGTAKSSLADARRGFSTKLLRKNRIDEPAPDPPPQIFRAIKYPSPIGELAAYVSPSPGDAKRHPAVIWIFGGFSNSTGETAWEPGSADNDQSASAFRKAGIIMMYPSLRGGNDNPGFIEGFYGEVDDIVAAADYVKKLEYVDPKRVYLGGHSTGGTLALLVAESTNSFRAVFSFGPVADLRGYGSKNLPFDGSDRRELELRAPGWWLQAIHNPTYVFEGTDPRSNIEELESLSRTNRNPLIHFLPVKGANHFSLLAPITRSIAAKILRDEGPSSNITFTPQELADALKQR